MLTEPNPSNPIGTLHHQGNGVKAAGTRRSFRYIGKTFDSGCSETYDDRGLEWGKCGGRRLRVLYTRRAFGGRLIRRRK